VKPRNVVALLVVLLLIGSVGFSESQRRTEKFYIPLPPATGLFIGSCGSFDILSEGTALMTGTNVYDKSGQFVMQIMHFRVIGESLYYNSTNKAKAVAGGPGEGEIQRFDAATGLVYGSGPSWKVRVPGYGLIWAETGHFVYDTNTGEFVFNSAHNQFIDRISGSV
jgi:hypothetical protein